MVIKAFYVTYLIQLHTTGIDYDCMWSDYCRDRSLFVVRGGKRESEGNNLFFIFHRHFEWAAIFSSKRPFDSGLSQSKTNRLKNLFFACQNPKKLPILGKETKNKGRWYYAYPSTLNNGAPIGFAHLGVTDSPFIQQQALHDQ